MGVIMTTSTFAQPAQDYERTWHRHFHQADLCDLEDG